MLPSEAVTIGKLSKLQREFLESHIDGMRPFRNDPQENSTRRSLIARGLIRYEPKARTLLGKPDGTVLTDPFGRQALAMILAWHIEYLIRYAEKRYAFGYLDIDKRDTLFKALAELTAP